MTVLYGYCLQAIRDRCSSCFMLWPWHVAIVQDHMISVQTHLLHVCLSMPKSACVCCHLFLHSRSVVLDCGHTPGQHAQCHNTPAAHLSEHGQKFLGSLPSFFLDCGHTPGQHAQCHNPPAAHIHKFIVCWVHGCWPLLPMYAGVHGLTTMLAQHLHYHCFKATQELLM